jgi:hypothetical protein
MKLCVDRLQLPPKLQVLQVDGDIMLLSDPSSLLSDLDLHNFAIGAFTMMNTRAFGLLTEEIMYVYRNPQYLNELVEWTLKTFDSRYFDDMHIILSLMSKYPTTMRSYDDSGCHVQRNFVDKPGRQALARGFQIVPGLNMFHKEIVLKGTLKRVCAIHFQGPAKAGMVSLSDFLVSAEIGSEVPPRILCGNIPTCHQNLTN